MTPPLFDGLPSPEFAEGGEGKSVLRVNALSFGAHRRIPDERVIATHSSRILKNFAMWACDRFDGSDPASWPEVRVFGKLPVGAKSPVELTEIAVFKHGRPQS